MKEYLYVRWKKLKKNHVIFRISLIIWVVAAVVIRWINRDGQVAPDFLLVFMIALLFFTIVYGFITIFCSSEYKSIKYLFENENIDLLVAGIDFEKEPSLVKSNIFCGDYAFASVGKGRIKTITLIPYNGLRWVYETKSYSGLKYQGSWYNFMYDDGVRFTASLDKHDFTYLMANYFTKYSPSIIIGYGKTQKKAYTQKMSFGHRLVFFFKP